MGILYDPPPIYTAQYVPYAASLPVPPATPWHVPRHMAPSHATLAGIEQAFTILDKILDGDGIEQGADSLTLSSPLWNSGYPARSEIAIPLRGVNAGIAVYAHPAGVDSEDTACPDGSREASAGDDDAHAYESTNGIVGYPDGVVIGLHGNPDPMSSTSDLNILEGYDHTDDLVTHINKPGKGTEMGRQAAMRVEDVSNGFNYCDIYPDPDLQITDELTATMLD
jgi:hypothetical protein